MAGHGPFDHPDCQRGTRSLAQTQAKRQKRLFAQLLQQAAVRALGADMPGNAVIQRTGGHTRQNRRRRTGDETVKDHRNPVHPRCQYGPRHRCNLAPAKAAQHLQRITQRRGVAQKPRRNRRFLSRKTGIIDTRAPARPARPAIKCRRKGSGHRCVANPHLARNEKVSGGIDRLIPCGKGGHDLGLGHRRAFGKVSGRSVKVQRVHVKLRPEGACKLVDRCPAMRKVSHHLRRHLWREGADAPRRNPMISRKYHDLRRIGMRPVGPLPARHPERQMLQPAKGTGGLGQLAIARLGCGNRGQIGGGKIGEQGTHIGESGKGGSGLKGHGSLGC